MDLAVVSVERNPRDQNQFFNERNSSQANQMATLEKWREFLFFRGSYFYPPSNKQSRQNVLHRALLISVAAHHGISSACFFQPGAKIVTSNLKQLFFLFRVLLGQDSNEAFPPLVWRPNIAKFLSPLCDVEMAKFPFTFTFFFETLSLDNLGLFPGISKCVN